MKMRFLALLFLPAFLALAGCLRFSLETLQKTTPEGTPFQKALTKEYQRLSEKEAALYDWVEAERFARKGLRSAAGEEVVPEDPEERDIADTMLSSVAEARHQLMKIVTDAVKEKHPEEAAQAYAAYECWIEELEEEWQIEHITACRDSFFDLINLLSLEKDEAAHKEIKDLKTPEDKPAVKAAPETKKETEAPEEKPVPVVEEEKREVLPPSAEELEGEQEAEIAPEERAPPLESAPVEEVKEAPLQEARPEEKKAEAPPAQTSEAFGKPEALEGKGQVSYEVYFDVNSTEITEAASNVLDQIIRAYKDTDRKIILNGYTDHSGNPRYNMTLSKLRAIAVKRELEKRGIPPERIVLFAFGEQEEKNGAVKNQNRRVHIIIE